MTTAALKRIFWAFFLPSTLCLLALGLIDLGLRNTTTPSGIISFELCAYTASCDKALLAWGAQGQSLAMLSLGLDYLYLVTYSGFICAGLLLVAAHVPAALTRLTTRLAWLTLAAGAADACENYALIQIVLNGSGGAYAPWASGFATLKFAVIGITLPWLIFTAISHVLLKRRGGA